jgi:UDP-2-acetamido-3-amino-2,3-dideoxy-glucuronate N-acetyltransferase
MKGSRIGKDCRIGQNVVVGPDATIGNGVKIQNNVSVYQGVTLEDHVFCGPSMVFTNVYNPRSEIRRMDEIRPTLVRRGATLGANCTVVCGVTIGTYAFVAAGTVVTRDVPDYALIVGSPGRVVGWMCTCGNRIAFGADGGTGACTECAKKFSRENLKVWPL